MEVFEIFCLLLKLLSFGSENLFNYKNWLSNLLENSVGFCHQSMERTYVADGRTASNMDGSYEYTEQSSEENRQGVDLQLGFRQSANKSSA
jgi:hypothetical protein